MIKINFFIHFFLRSNENETLLNKLHKRDNATNESFFTNSLVFISFFQGSPLTYMNSESVSQFNR